MTRRCMMLAGVAGPLWAMLVIAGGMLLTPGYSPLRDTVSQLSAQDRPYGGLIAGGIVFYGLLLLPFSIELKRCLGDTRPARIAASALIVSALATIATGVVRVSPQSTPVTATDIVHFFAAGMMQFSLIIGMLAAGLLFQRDGLKTQAVFSVVIAISGSVMVAALMTGQLSSVIGLAQRAVYFQALAWIELLALLTLRGRVSRYNPLTQRYERTVFAAAE